MREKKRNKKTQDVKIRKCVENMDTSCLFAAKWFRFVEISEYEKEHSGKVLPDTMLDEIWRTANGAKYSRSIRCTDTRLLKWNHF